MSTILITGIVIDAILLFIVAALWSASLQTDNSKEDFQVILKSMSSIMHILEMTKDGKAKTEDVAAEVDRTAASVSQCYESHERWSRKYNVWAIVLAAIAVATLAATFVIDNYVDNKVSKAYLEGHKQGLKEWGVLYETRTQPN